MIDKKERIILVSVLIVIAFWFTLGIQYFYNISSNNSSLFYFLFLLGYVFLINKLIYNEGFDFKRIFSLFIILLVGDILLFPYLIVADKSPELSTNLKYSADVFVYSLLPLTWNHTLKYYLTYIVIPLLLLILLAYIHNKNRFIGLLKMGGT